jgi:hypothetical protein
MIFNKKILHGKGLCLYVVSGPVQQNVHMTCSRGRCHSYVMMKLRPTCLLVQARQWLIGILSGAFHLLATRQSHIYL